MPRQHEPPAGETTSPVAVRRAVPVPPPGEDPGADLGPHTPDPTAPVPIPESPTPAPRRLFGRRSGSAATEPASAGPAQQPERQQQQAAGDGPGPEAAAGVLFAGHDGDPGDPGTAGESPGRPRGPMLAAAAIAGAVLISVPFLVLGLRGDDERVVNTAPVGGTTLDPGLSDDRPAADYTAESPSPSASPSPSKSPSPKASAVEVKAAPQAVVKETPVAKPTATAKAKAKKAAAPTARQLANALSNRANVLLKNVATGKCADLPNFGKGQNDGPVNQYICRPTDTDNQLWDLEVTDADGGPGGASLFIVKNRQDGLCLDLPYNGSVSPETVISEFSCDGTNGDNQLWWLDPRPEGYWIRNVASNLCIEVTGGRVAGDDARLQVAKCGDTQLSAQRWMISQVVKP
ncbi:RICIN domain-containing protein [Streptomyces shenzhenensis]|uniref:RICIN domain-containing protein n=1 Tax=Streptomyces shenzhenensis TaxID=943815 RepID=UPI003812B6E4